MEDRLEPTLLEELIEAVILPDQFLELWNLRQ
jgi:hypothetical protein